jgi:hypothetical protein
VLLDFLALIGDIAQMRDAVLQKRHAIKRRREAQGASLNDRDAILQHGPRKIVQRFCDNDMREQGLKAYERI